MAFARIFSGSFSRLFSMSVVGSIGLVVACSGGDEEGAGSSGGFVSEFCGIFSSQCCAKNGYPTDGNSCRNLYNNVANGKEYDAAKGESCLAALRATQSNPDFCQSGPGADACQGVFKTPGGGAPPGGECEDNVDCALSSEGEVECHTVISNQTTRSTCQLRVRGKEGDACHGTKSGDLTSTSGGTGTDGAALPRITICDTADGLHCDNATDKCVRVQDVGGPCTSTALGGYECVKTAFCNRQEKKCAARHAAGETCTGTSSFDNDCVDKHYCDGATKKCTPKLALDAPCQKNEQCETGSCVNGKCGTSGLGNLGYVLLCGPKSDG